MKMIRRKIACLLLASMIISFLCPCFAGVVGTAASGTSERENIQREIFVVYDNSGSMYFNNEDGKVEKLQTWCRAKYAMEIFAAMLGENDTLRIYPMNPVTTDGSYDKDKSSTDPVVIEDTRDIHKIHQMITFSHSDGSMGTPYAAVTAAYEGLSSVSESKEKWLIVLTDGEMYDGGTKVPKEELCKRLNNIAKDVNVEYLCIGTDPNFDLTTESNRIFGATAAAESTELTKCLSDVCNRIFRRDALPAAYIKGKTISFDVTMKRLIILAQGEGSKASSLKKSTGEEIAEMPNSRWAAKASEYSLATGEYPTDTSLKGEVVIFGGETTPLLAGEYTLDYSGDVIIFYEPDVDLDFVFTDSSGAMVDYKRLYEGNYKVSYGMKDAKSGKLTSSKLLGNPKYKGSYFINGKETPFTAEGFSGSVDIPLKMDENFEATLTVNYLSDYYITKTSSDFGWPDGGIIVAPRPAGDLKLEITGGDGSYSLQKLEEGAPFIAKVYYKGTQLTGSELEKVKLSWDSKISNAEIKSEFAKDHWKLSLHYKDPAAPENTICGECTVPISAAYSAQGSSEAKAQSPLTYNIKDNFSPVQIELVVPQDYIVIKDLKKSKPITAKLSVNGRPLTAEEFAATTLTVDCGGIKHTVTPKAEDSSCLIKLLPTDGIGEGDYSIKVNAKIVDQFGRAKDSQKSTVISLGYISILLKWLIGILILLIIIFIIWSIAHIRVLPSRVRADTESCSLHVGGKDETQNANFYAKLSGKQLTAYVEYNADEIGRVVLNNLVPGKESYLSKPSHKRSIYVKFPESVSVSGDMTAIDIAGIGYIVNKNGDLTTDDEQQGAYSISNGGTVTINGKTLVAGKEKKFNAEIPLNFKK